MKILGSTTSPYVRRLKLFFLSRGIEFIDMDIFEANSRTLLTDNNPIQKIPVLIDNEQIIYDSNVIYRYLSEKYQLDKMSWHQENLLTLINGANDALVSMLVLERSAIDTSEDALFFNLQRERVQHIMKSLSEAVAKGEFNSWHYLSVSLFCLLDWMAFRSLYQWQDDQTLLAFFEQYNREPMVKETDPRIS